MTKSNLMREMKRFDAQIRYCVCLPGHNLQINDLLQGEKELAHLV
jgi:hypothetical protein